MERGFAMKTFFMWFVVFSMLGGLSVLLLLYVVWWLWFAFNFYIVVFMVVVMAAACLAVIFTLMEKMDSRVHELERIVGELVDCVDGDESRVLFKMFKERVVV